MFSVYLPGADEGAAREQQRLHQLNNYTLTPSPSSPPPPALFFRGPAASSFTSSLCFCFLCATGLQFLQALDRTTRHTSCLCGEDTAATRPHQKRNGGTPALAKTAESGRASSLWPTLHQESSNHTNKLCSRNTDLTVCQDQVEALLVFVTLTAEILLS